MSARGCQLPHEKTGNPAADVPRTHIRTEVPLMTSHSIHAVPGPAKLARMLRAQAAGLRQSEAAVELLVVHDYWLGHGPFIRQFITAETDLDGVGGTPMAVIDWPAAIDGLDNGLLRCSSSEGAFLRLAASLARGVPVDLREAVSGLGGVTLTCVLIAIARANGRELAEVRFR
jgi:hypothetical protein